ncbi:MAG: TolC family protein [Planctomycetota bacterium]|jgi:outer membrane protein TolC
MVKRVVSGVIGVVLSAVCALVFGGRESVGPPPAPAVAQERRQETSAVMQALEEIIEIRQAILDDTEESHRMGRADLAEVAQAQINVSEARLQLARAQGRQEAAVGELRMILAAREETVKSIQERQDFGLATQGDLHEAVIAALETKVRLARALHA